MEYNYEDDIYKYKVYKEGTKFIIKGTYKSKPFKYTMLVENVLLHTMKPYLERHLNFYGDFFYTAIKERTEKI
jgi:hypothetical protein